MKRMMMITALSALAAGAMAQSEQIDSGNIVGYTKIGLEKTRMMLGVTFKDIAAATRIMDLSSIETDANPDGGTRLSWWTGAGYDSAVWQDAWDEDGVTELFINTWVDYLTQVPVATNFTVGTGFFIDGPAGVNTVLLKGELVTSKPKTDDPWVEVPLAQVREMVVNPMPVAINITNIFAEGVTPDGGARISWWTGAGYDSAVWQDAWDEDGVTELYIDTWVDYLTQVPVTNRLEIGEGFFLDGAAGKSLFFPNPLAE